MGILAVVILSTAVAVLIQAYSEEITVVTKRLVKKLFLKGEENDDN